MNTSINLEALVQLAIQCELTGSEVRRVLLQGLPTGFAYSLPTVSRPIDQLRFDLMELQRTPRLIGLDKPPLAVWLCNAAMYCAGLKKFAEAERFAEYAQELGFGGVIEKVKAAKMTYRGQTVSKEKAETPKTPRGTNGNKDHGKFK